MPGKFLLFAASELISTKYDPTDKRTVWNRRIITVPKTKLFYQQRLAGRTGVAIFGPSQDAWLDIFLKAEVKILFKSKKCVNPNHKGYAPEQRNTVVVFEGLK